MHTFLLFLRKYSGLFLLIGMMMNGGVVVGQNIATNPITGTNPNTANPYTTGQTVVANLTFSGIGRGSGATGSSANDRYNANSWNTPSIDNTAYFEFILTPATGYKIDFTSFVYTGQASGTGPTSFAFRSSIDNYASNLGSPSAIGVTIDLSAISFQNITTAVTFRLYGWGASASAGTFSVNDFTFNGTVTSAGIVSAGSGDWNTAATWNPVGVPGSTDNVTIAAGHTVYTTTALTRNAATTVNGTFELRDSGYASGTNFTYGAAGTLNFNTTAIYGVSDDHVYWPSSGGPTNVNILQGGISLTGANRTVAGTFATASGVTISGGSLTLNGICQINGGGFFNNAPIYGNASTLVYNSVTGYGVSNEWNSTSFVVGSGVPQNVTLTNSSVNLPAFTRGMAGNLTIDANSTLNHVANNALIVAGNWSNAGVFNSNNGVVSLRGGAALQTITNTNPSSANTETFSTLIVSKTSGTTLRLDSNININGNSGNVLRMLDAGQLNLNGKILSLNNDGGNIYVDAVNRTITSSIAGGKVEINGGKVIANNAGTGTLTLGTNVTVNLNTNGNLNFGLNITTLSGTLSINSTTNCFVNTNPPIYGNASTLIYNNVNGYGVANEWNGNASTAGAGTPQNVTVTSSTITLPNTTISLAGNLSIGSGSFFNMSSTLGADLRIGGNLTNNGTFTGNGRKVFFTGAINPQIITSNTVLTIPYIELATAGTATVQLAGDLVVSAPAAGNAITFTNASNVLDINGRTLTIGSVGVDNAIFGSGSFKGSTASNLILLGTGTLGTLRFSSDLSLGNLTLNKQNNTIGFELGTNLTVAGILDLIEGVIEVANGSELRIGNSGSITGFDNTDFIIANSGRLRKGFSNGTGVARNFTFPIGTSIASYTPATIDVSTGNFSSGYLSLSVVNAKEPNNFSPTHFINRYWNVQGDGITNATYSFAGDFLVGDIQPGANITSMKSGRYRVTPGSWIQDPNSLTENKISFSNITTTVDGAFSSTGGYNFTAGNPFSLAEINVKQGFTNIVSGGSYDFGNLAMGSSTTISFTIENLGLETLNLNAATIVNSNFTLSSPYAATVLGNGTTQFQISFVPTTLGAISGSISIPHNDATGSENPYIVNFTAVGGYSANSEIIAAGNESVSISSLENDVAINTIADGAEVWQFTIRDGGALFNDIDTAPTILNTLTLTQGVGNMIDNWSDAIQAVALFNGANKLADGVVTGTQIVFSGAPLISVPDGTGVTLSLRLSIQTNPNNLGNYTTGNLDNDDFQFSITNTNTATSGGSQMSSFPVATSTNDLNRLSVIATQLAFVQQPSITGIGASMTPAVTIHATDINGNRDRDYTTAVSITSTGTLTGTPVNATPVLGLATFSTLTHSVAGTGFALSAASIGLSGATSSAFDITTIVYLNGDYRTKPNAGAFTYTSNSSTPNQWEIYNNGWVASNSPFSNTNANIYISTGTTVTTGTQFNANPNLYVLDGGKFTSTLNSFFNTVYVYSGGTYEFTTSTFTINNLLEVEDNGNFIFNLAGTHSAGLTTSLWRGTEKFHPNSNFIVKDHETGGGKYFFPPASNLTSNSFDGVTAYFGNLIFETEARLTTTNLSGSSIFVTHGNLEFSAPINYALFYGNGTWTVGKDLIVNDGSSGNVTITTSSITATLNVKRNFINNSNKSFIMVNDSNGTGNITLNVDGFIALNGTIGCILDTNRNGISNVNLKGNLFVNESSRLYSFFSNATSNFNFAGTTEQTIDVRTTGGANTTNLKFFINSGATAKLINQDFVLGTGSSLEVKSGGAFDFGFNGTTALNVTGPAFESKTASTLKITSPAGIATSGATGNVQTTTRTFSTGTPFGNFNYIGQANQITGNALPATVNNLTVNNETLTNDLTLSQAVKVQGALTMNSGNIVTSDANLLEIGTGTANKGSLNYTNGFVKGPLKRWFSGVNSGTASSLFPLGTVDNKNRFAQIEYTTAPIAGALTAKLQGTMGVLGLMPPPEVPATGSCTNFNVLSTDDMYWSMTASDNLANGFYNATVTKENDSAPETDICKQTILAGTMLSWSVLGSHEEPTGMPTNITLKRTGLNAIKDLGIGKGYCSTIIKIYDEVSDWTTTPPTILDKIAVYANYTIPANTIVNACECAVSNGATLTVSGNATLAVVESVSVWTGASIDINNHGSLVQYRNVDNATENDNIGDIKMQRITKPLFRFDYTYWSSPVQDFVLKSVSPTTLFDKFFSWNEFGTPQAWQVHLSNLAEPLLEIMAPGRGYIVRAPQSYPIETPTAIAQEYTAYFIGRPNNGTVEAPIFGSTSPNPVDNKWNLLGNPYPSAIDGTTFLDANANLGGTLYFWTHNTAIGVVALGSYSPNDYASWNKTGGVATSPAPSSAPGGTGDNEINAALPTGKIAAGQGFFVKGIGSGAGLATFNNSMRLAGENNQFFKAAVATNTTNTTPQENHRVWLNIKGAVKGFNQLLVGYVTNATNDFDNRYDGESFGGNLVTFYSINNTKNLVIQGRALPFVNTDTVPLGYKTTLTGNLTISIDHVDGGMVGQDIYLQDNVLNVVHDLTESNYVFATVPGTFNNRFVLRYLPQENLSNPTFDDKLKSVTIYKYDATLHVNSPYETIATIAVYDLTGRLVFERKDCNTNRFETTELLSVDQALIVKVTLMNGAVVSEKVL